MRSIIMILMSILLSSCSLFSDSIIYKKEPSYEITKNISDFMHVEAKLHKNSSEFVMKDTVAIAVSYTNITDSAYTFYPENCLMVLFRLPEINLPETTFISHNYLYMLSNHEENKEIDLQPNQSCTIVYKALLDEYHPTGENVAYFTIYTFLNRNKANKKRLLGKTDHDIPVIITHKKL